MRKFKYLFAAALLMICMAFVSRTDSGTGPSVIKVLDGSAGQLKVDSVVLIEDPVFYGSAYDGKRVTPYRVQNMVSLEVNEDALIPIETDFDVTARLLIKKTDYLGAVTQSTIDLTVNHRKDSAYKHKRTHLFANAHRVEVKVVALSKNVAWDAYSVLKVVNQMETFPEFTWDCANNAVQTISVASGVTIADELPVSWPVSIGADEYDLEWTFIDSFSLGKGLYGNPLQPKRIFANNASRVTVTGTSYRIPLFYDRGGKVFFRVRSVRWSSKLGPEGGRMEANWSSDQTSGFGEYPFAGHEQQINWQSTTSFAEEGKRKTIVQYYDGSLRARQTVTKDNVTNNTVVAESMYDYQGRPVIQVMPTPTLSNVIKYAKGFNRAPQNVEYDKSLYDTVGNPNAFCAIESIPMDDTSGASRYYSPSNDSARSKDPRYRFIPDAELYPFTEVEYTQDGTGRVLRQSGVGKTFRLGGGRETVYTYGSADQNELDALFGTEVGNASHYQKNVVRDANGQYSISYVDMRGRTIATALAGELPSDTKLDALSSQKKEARTRVLADSGSAVLRDLIMESKKTITVEDDNVKHVFNYQLDPMSLQKEGCAIPATQFCYDCLYDLQITITSDCNNGKLNRGGLAFDTLISNFSLNNFDTTCTSNPPAFNVNFTLFLSKGTYEITKKLMVSQQAMDYYRNIFLKRSQCITLDSFANEVRKAQALGNNCSPECATCLSSLGDWPAFWAQYRLKGGIANADTLKYKDGALKDYDNALRACNELCEKNTAADEYRSMMLSDLMAPTGQYADTARLDDPRNIFYHNDVASAGPLRTKPYYQLVTNYKDAAGNPALVYRESTGRMVAPQDLTMIEFLANFEESWAEALLQYHPEYCMLNNYTVLKTSHEWDKRFQVTETYAVARQKGYMNPTGSTAAPHNYFSATGTADYDPLATLLGVSFKTSMEYALANFKTIASSTYTMQGYSAFVALCQTGSSPLCGSNTANGSYLANSSAICDGDRDMAWKTFRTTYWQWKKEKILTWLNTQCTSPAATLAAEGHIPRFAHNELLALYPVMDSEPTSLAEANAQKDLLALQAQEYYKSNCEVYAEYWVNSLVSSCTLYNITDLKDKVIPKLIEVCRQGADVDHQFGSSTVAPSSTHKYRSFQDVINEYNISKGITDVNCNAYVITSPKPYDQREVPGKKPLLKKPADCECELINKYHQQFTNRGSGYATFGKFMREVYNTPISDTAADYLVGLCNTSSTCTFLSGMVTLPPAFQCNTGDVCIDCTKFKSVDSTFRAIYPHIWPTADPNIADSTFIRWNKLYESYMNYRTGFSMTAREYLDFAQQCFGPLNSIGCDSLNRILTGYELQRKTYGIGYKLGYTHPSGAGVTLTDPQLIVKNGTLKLPDTSVVSSGIGHTMMALNGATLCGSQGYTIEMRFKYLQGGHASNLFYFLGGRYSVTFARSGNSIVLTNLAAPEPGVDYPMSVVAYPDSGVVYNWCTVKAKVTPSLYQVYFNGKLIHTRSRNPATPIPNFQAIGASFNSRYAVVDYYKFYNHGDTLKYFEDFNVPKGYSVPLKNSFCPAGTPPDCQTEFVNYFNQQNGSSLTLQQIEALYVSKCGRAPNVCGDTDTLGAITSRFTNNLLPNRVIPMLVTTEGLVLNDSLVTEPSRIMRDGAMQWEQRLQARNHNLYTYHRITAPDGIQLCTGLGFSAEARMKVSQDVWPAGNDLFFFNNPGNGSWVVYRGTGGTYIRQVALPNGSSDVVYTTNINLSSDPNAIRNWNDYKVSYAADSVRFYFNGVKKGAIRNPRNAVVNTSYFHWVVYSYKAMVDWVKVHDGKGKPVYTENFNDPDKLAAFDPSFICSVIPNCQTSFANYFNQQRGTSYTFNQIDSLYYAKTGRSLDVCGARDTLLNVAGRYNVNQNPTRLILQGPISSYAPDQYITDGVLRNPDAILNSTSTPQYLGFRLTSNTAFCTTKEYTLEAKLKVNKDIWGNHEVLFFNDGNVRVVFDKRIGSSLPNGINLYRIFARDPANPSALTNIFPTPINVNPYTAGLIQAWSLAKFVISPTRIKVYWDGSLRADLARPITTFQPVTHLDLYFNSAFGALDWVKAYDENGKQHFYEDFDDPQRRALINQDFLCPKPSGDCKALFVTYFNQQRGTNYNYSQIDSIYYATTGSYVNVCGEPPMTGPYNYTLCGRSQPVFPGIMAKPVDICSDSTFFIYSKAQTLYKHYTDSLYGTFDSLYRAKCMSAYKFERFTVSDTAREYHYTLYYYDQGGNLVKTIPPAGVKPNRDPVWLNNVKVARAAGNVLVPAHELPTDYRYNALNQVVAQKSPDGGQSKFWYDRLGRLTVSQNAKQRYASATEENRLYSYTKYDILGRITEVGQVKNLSSNGAMLDTTSRTPSLLNSWMVALNQRREQITSTVYDLPYTGFVVVPDNSQIVKQRNLRNRVSYTTYTDGWNTANYNQGSFYTYDIHGNVDTLLQDYGCGSCGITEVQNLMNQNGNRFKKVSYNYDLISGKVNSVAYQRGWSDQFYHRYFYDGENRLTQVETSLDGFSWEKDARYQYYLHGPLARTILGNQQVQGIDYAYTLQGWLKGVNSTGAKEGFDIGGDGVAGLSQTTNRYVARDAFGFALNYYNDDYKAINDSVVAFPGYSSYLNTEFRPLYNGNISSMVSTNRVFENPAATPDTATILLNYRYDQLNRIKGMDVYNQFDRTSNQYNNIARINAFNEQVNYDGNGNILSYKRNGSKSDTLMDDLTYQYYPGTNKLRRVGDNVPASRYGSLTTDKIVDIDDQADADNYNYDSIGNLIQDKAEKITNITWNVYGKITSISRTSGTQVPASEIRYTYDAAGNRISKLVEKNGRKYFTWYVRDAQGNVMATYSSDSTSATALSGFVLKENERYIYGSSRLGVATDLQLVDNANAGPAKAVDTGGTLLRGMRMYELSNHLGNVLVTISDKKNGIADPIRRSWISHFEPVMLSGTDYYPFGMAMRVGGDNKYKYGFNGKENDNEVKGGDGLQQDYGMRVYDNRLGRFLSVDPITKAFPQLSPYQFASNSPILGIDMDGLEFYNSNDSKILISLKYDPVLGKLTSASTYFRIEKLPDGLVAAIDKANTCVDCIGSDKTEVQRFAFSALNPLVKNVAGTEAKDMEIPENTSVGPNTKGSQTLIVPKNKKEASQQQKSRTFFTDWSSKAVERFGVKMAALDLAASLVQWAGNENIESIINKARAQSQNGALTAIALIQKAINDGIIDKKTDEYSLNAIANYLLYGKAIEKSIIVDGEVKYVKDEQMTQVANKILTDYLGPINEKKRNEESRNDKKQKKDNTSKSGNGF